MKKYIPFILLGVGILVTIVAIFFVKGRAKTNSNAEEDESSLIKVSVEDSPVVSIIPRTDGHWVDLTISNLGKFDAESFEYQLLFNVPKSGLQGESGLVELSDIENNTYTKEVLVGTESSGNYYYYNNVEEGEFALKFRNSNGKLVAKFETELKFGSDFNELSSIDGKLTYKFEDVVEEQFVVMNTFGVPSTKDGALLKLPIGIFSSADDPLPGEVEYEGKVARFDSGSWTDLTDGKSDDIGIFVFYE